MLANKLTFFTCTTECLANEEFYTPKADIERVQQEKGNIQAGDTANGIKKELKFGLASKKGMS